MKSPFVIVVFVTFFAVFALIPLLSGLLRVSEEVSRATGSSYFVIAFVDADVQTGIASSSPRVRFRLSLDDALKLQDAFGNEVAWSFRSWTVITDLAGESHIASVRVHSGGFLDFFLPEQSSIDKRGDNDGASVLINGDFMARSREKFRCQKNSMSVRGRQISCGGIVREWTPVPRLYDLDQGFSSTEDILMSAELAREINLSPIGTVSCPSARPRGGMLEAASAGCRFVTGWIRVNQSFSKSEIDQFLDQLAADGRRSGTIRSPESRFERVSPLRYAFQIGLVKPVHLVVGVLVIVIVLLSVGGNTLVWITGLETRRHEIACRWIVGCSAPRMITEYSLKFLAATTIGCVFAAGILTFVFSIADGIHLIDALAPSTLGWAFGVLLLLSLSAFPTVAFAVWTMRVQSMQNANVMSATLSLNGQPAT